MSSIIVGSDGEPDCDDAIRFAAAEASRRGAVLTAVIAYPRPLDGADGPVPSGSAQAAAVRRLLRALDRCSSDLLPPERTAVVADEGEVADVLLRESVDAQLLVLGRHERHGLGRLLSGGTTRGRVLRHARCPVAVVPRDR